MSARTVRHESVQGQWEMVRAAPHPSLRPYVRGYIGWFEHFAVPICRREVPTEDVPRHHRLRRPGAIVRCPGPVAMDRLRLLHDRRVRLARSGRLERALRWPGNHHVDPRRPAVPRPSAARAEEPRRRARRRARPGRPPTDDGAVRRADVGGAVRHPRPRAGVAHPHGEGAVRRPSRGYGSDWSRLADASASARSSTKLDSASGT